VALGSWVVVFPACEKLFGFVTTFHQRVGISREVRDSHFDTFVVIVAIMLIDYALGRPV
jgi:hypothetical protein